MSGGLAYVYDPDGDFTGRINPTMVNQIEQLEDTDRFELRRLIEDHARRTGSTVAAGILDDWEERGRPFRQGVPDRLQACAGRTRSRCDRVPDSPEHRPMARPDR